MTAPYYRNTYVNLGGFSVGELTRALDDSADFFDGPAPDSQKQSVLEKLVVAGQHTVSPLRRMGFVVDIVRSYCEGAANHGTGYVLDISPASKNYSDCYAIASTLKGLNTCDQIWIEASDDEGNFHVHVKANPQGYNKNPDLQTITDPEGGSGTPGLEYYSTSISSLKQVTT